MGALTNYRKRVGECFNLHSPSPSFNSPNRLYHYGNQIDTHIAKKPRISHIESPGKVIDLQQSAVSRLSRYPEPEKLPREVHAPCRSYRFGFSSTVSKREDSGIRAKALQMGNTLKVTYEQAKHNSFGVLRYFKGGKDREVVDLEAEPHKRDAISKDWGVVEIVEDGDAVRSVVSDYHIIPGNDGLEAEIQELDGKALESGTAQASSALSELTKVEHARKMMSSISLDLDCEAYRNREAYKELLSKVEKRYANNLSTLEFEIKSTLARWEPMWSFRQSLEKEKEEKKPDELKKPGEDLLREPFVPLTQEEERDVSRAFSHSNRRKILVTHEASNIEISGEIFQCLRPGAWLNDEVINIYLELLKERERREPKNFLNCHFFNTFFYKKLIGGRNGYDYKAVRRWTTQRKLGYGLMDCDKIFVPIHKEVHWCLAVIDKKDKSFQYLDSLGGRDHQVLRVLSRYFMDEVKDKSGQEIDVGSWKLEFVEDLPEQQNGFDCGMFLIKYADFYSRGLGLHFSQENMPYFRRRTAKEILRLRAD